jgi:hypothetical protein
MFFEELHNGILINSSLHAWQGGRNTPWLQKLNQWLFQHALYWYPNVIIVDNARVEFNANRYYVNSKEIMFILFEIFSFDLVC